MVAFRKTSVVLLASTFALALAMDTADARRGGTGGARAGGGGMRASAVGTRGGFANRAHVSRPIAGTGRFAGNGVVGGGRWNGNRPGYGYRPGYGLGAAAVAGAAVGAGLAYSNCYGGNCGDGYYNARYDNGYGVYASGGGYYNTGYESGYGAYASGGDGSNAYASAGYATAVGDTSDAYILNGTTISEADAIAYCAQRFRSYDAASQTFLSYSGERKSCPQ
jgi:hypothetical protein